MEKSVAGALAIRPFTEDDVDAAVSIAARSPQGAQWSRGDYARASGGEFDGWVAEWESRRAGFLIVRCMADEMEIMNLAVEAVLRRRGVASRLLETALAFGSLAGARTVFLEVRASNSGALAFYQRHGFVRSGRRPRYYTRPLEDALVLSRKLGSNLL